MRKRILIVHSDKEMSRAIEDILDEVLKTKGHHRLSSSARSLREAENQVAQDERLDLVVSSLEIPEDDKPLACAGEQQRLGLKLIRRLRDEIPGTVAILTTGHVDDEVFDSLRKENVGLVREGASFKDQLQSEITRYLIPNDPQEPKRIDLRIALSANNECRWRFHEGGRDLGEGRLEIDRTRLTDLVDDSREIDTRISNHYKQKDLRKVGKLFWEKDLRKVGEALAEQLFQTTPENLKFRDKFHELMGQVGIENIRVRFEVEDALHPIAVEALKRREVDQEAWMLRTAVIGARRRNLVAVADSFRMSRLGSSQSTFSSSKQTFRFRWPST